MASREEYIDKLESRLREWNEQIDRLQERAEKESREMKGKLSARIERAKEKRSRLSAKLEEIREAGDESFDRIRDDAEQLWDDLKAGISDIRSVLKK